MAKHLLSFLSAGTGEKNDLQQTLCILPHLGCKCSILFRGVSGSFVDIRKGFLKVVTNEKGEAVEEVVTIIC
jgi:hypothetical protein